MNRWHGVTQLGFLGLRVRDLDAWEAFAEVFGLSVQPGTLDTTRYFRMDDYHHRMVVEVGEADDLETLGFETAGEAALAELANRLREAGHAVEWGDASDLEHRCVSSLIRFVDPDGISCEAYCGPLVMRDVPFRSPRPIGGFRTGRLGLGHVTVTVADLRKSIEFYEGLLGFRLTDRVRPQPERGAASSLNLAFLRCNPRHHSLAMWENRGASQRLHHFMVEMQQIDDVGATLDLCQDRSIPIELTLGRHTNDDMLSFYARTPSGFWAECGWGGLEIDDATWSPKLHTTGSRWGHRRLA
jgi:2,3-dihydroxybiphenyl 1,2-dioxygenase